MSLKERGFWGFGTECRGSSWRPLGVLLFALLLFTPDAHSKDLHGRLGLGYNSEFASSQAATNGTPAISLKYAMTRDFAGAIVFGMKGGSPNSSVLAAKFFKNIFFENNLNFYFTTGLGILSALGSSGIELLGGFGSEFFIPGIESLGFSVETGASYNTLGGHSTLRTIGFSFLDAGIHFYF